MAGSALKRLMAEHRQLMANPPGHWKIFKDDIHMAWKKKNFGIFRSLTFYKKCPFFIFVQCFKEALVAGPKNDDNYFEWDANILGPEDTCFEYG